MTKPGILKHNSGAIKPTNEFKNQPQNSNTGSNKEKFKNQKKSIKISTETYKQLLVLKTMNGIKYDYETVELLLKNNYSNMTAEERKRYDAVLNNL